MTAILHRPNEVLTRKSLEIAKIDNSTKKIVDDLIGVTKKVDGPFNFFLGMAAPQIGITKRVFILRKSYKKYDVFINPEIISFKFLLPAFSRCYSVRGIALLRRYYWIKVKFQNLEGKEKVETFWGPKAFVVQHEIDHLNGKLIK